MQRGNFALISAEGLVIDAARALGRQGIEPSIIHVQGRIGGGSYTTVKRHLDAWRQRQAEQASAVDLPPELAEKGNALIRASGALSSSGPKVK